MADMRTKESLIAEAWCLSLSNAEGMVYANATKQEVMYGYANEEHRYEACLLEERSAYYSNR